MMIIMIMIIINIELMNEAEYLMKNYGDRGGCYPLRPSCCSPNSRCCPLSCLAVLAMFLAIFCLVLTVETSEMSAIFQVHNQNNSTSSPGLLG